MAITFIHNLLRRHPSCNVLVHRNGDTELPAAAAVGDAAAAAAATDPYLPDAVKPAESDAIKSSLWELHALKQHLYPQVHPISPCRPNLARSSVRRAYAYTRQRLTAEWTVLGRGGLFELNSMDARCSHVFQPALQERAKFDACCASCVHWLCFRGRPNVRGSRLWLSGLTSRELVCTSFAHTFQP